jgi:hypothetical protein
MDYTQSNSFDTDAGTGHRMHEDAKAIPTVWSAADANSIIWSLMEIAAAAGLPGLQFNKATPATYRVVLNALRSNALICGVDTGAANAAVVNFASPIDGLVDGMVLWFKANASNTGATTLNVNALGAKAVVGGAHAALQGGEIVAGGRCMVLWNLALNSFVLIECTGAALQVGPATKSQHAVQLSQVNGRLIRTTRYVRVGTVQNVSVDGSVNTTTNATIFTRHPDTKWVRVKVQGGGSGGAGSLAASGTNVSLGPPGSSGSYGESIFDAATVGGGSITVTVGLGSAGSSGATGGTSTFGLLMSVPGGTGASALINQAPPVINGNGVPATAPTGANLIALQGASPQVSIALNNVSGTGGAGGPSVFGPGGNGAVLNTNGTNAVNYGSGGSGTVVNSGGGTATGGNGAPGIVIVEEYA